MSIVIIGDIILDVNHFGTSTRLAQEACIPVFNINESKTQYTLGGVANVYCSLKQLGCNINIITVVGYDSKETTIIREQLGEHYSSVGDQTLPAVNCITDKSRTTTTKQRYYVNKKIIFRCDNENTHDIDENVEREIITKYEKYLSACKILILSDYNKGVLTSKLTRKLIEMSNERNIKVFVDPKVNDIHKYENCFLIKPNQNEGEYICGHKMSKNNYEISTTEIRKIINCDICLLTLGENGLVINHNENIVHIYEHASDVIDIIGAGDIVLAGFAFYYLKTNNIFTSAKFSNYCGQLKVKNLGTMQLTPYDVIMYEKGINKMVETSEIKSLTDIIKKNNKKIVATNGCFDILHVGHFSLLEKAKELGDVLIVCINSDYSVKLNKGDNRPLNNIEYRCKQLSMMNCVDYIITFEEKTPYEILKIIKPDVLVKGGDYNIENIIGCEFAKSVVLIDYIDGFSTTSIINNIMQNK